MHEPNPQRLTLELPPEAAFLAAFRELELPYVSCAGTVVMVKTPASDSLSYRQLMRRGIAVRTMTGLRLPNGVPTSHVLEPVMSDFLAGFREVIEQPREDGGQ